MKFQVITTARKVVMCLALSLQYIISAREYAGVSVNLLTLARKEKDIVIVVCGTVGLHQNLQELLGLVFRTKKRNTLKGISCSKNKVIL